MNLFVDTCVWSLAMRRDHVPESRLVVLLANALEAGNPVWTTGLVLQELLQGFRGPKQRTAIESRFAELPFIIPDRTDHAAAADLRSGMRRLGVQVGTIDALLAQLCIRHGLTMVSDDHDFVRIAATTALVLA